MAREQLQVLGALDAAQRQWYHFIAIIIAGMGFLTGAYDLFCISLVTKLLGPMYYHVDGAKNPGSLPPNVSAAANGVAFCGTLAGQLFFGWLGDKMGRKRVYGVTLMLMIFSSIASGLSIGSDPKAVMGILCFFRFWLGFGIGEIILFPLLSCQNMLIRRLVEPSWLRFLPCRIWNFSWRFICNTSVICIYDQIQCSLLCNRSNRLNCNGSRSCLENCSNVWSNSSCINLVLENENARNCSLYSAGCQGCEAGCSRHL